MKVYVTKYALTAGIELIEVEECHTPDTVVQRGKFPVSMDAHYHGEGREWHRTPESAFDRAEEMRKKKLVSLRKSIAAVEKINFEAQLSVLKAGAAL